jgi:hypothetical protein
MDLMVLEDPLASIKLRFELEASPLTGRGGAWLVAPGVIAFTGVIFRSPAFTGTSSIRFGNAGEPPAALP